MLPSLKPSMFQLPDLLPQVKLQVCLSVRPDGDYCVCVTILSSPKPSNYIISFQNRPKTEVEDCNELFSLSILQHEYVQVIQNDSSIISAKVPDFQRVSLAALQNF